MRRLIDIDEARFEVAGLKFERVGDLGTFTFDEITHHGTNLTIPVTIEDGKLAFFPLRSAGQRKVLAKLGTSTPT
jgi:hypothetical protein